jgi:Mor family transcriptional regulator
VTTLDLLPDDADLDPRLAIEHAEGLADAREAGKWPLRLLELADIVEAEIQRHAERPGTPREQAERLVVAIASLHGGRPFYLPRGDDLKRMLKYRALWRDYRGRNHEELADRYGYTLPQVYKIVAEMKSLEKRKRQPGLF